MAISSGRRSLTVPGLLPEDPFLERYWVRPGGATVLALEGDDRLTIRDPDGGQVAEVTLDLDVPFLLKPFKSKALEVIEREIKVWVAKAKRGEI